MIQRIQSIFLLLAAVSSLGLLALPFATTPEAKTESALFADSSFNLWDNTALTALFIAAAVLSLLSVFLFNNRKLQMRTAILAIILVLVGAGLAASFFVQDSASSVAQFAFGTIMPVLAVIFSLLAYRAIGKDEKLVRSADRLR